MYGSSQTPATGPQNTSVFVATGLPTPIGVQFANSFPYSTGTLEFSVGDTIFFHGVKGYYGAWHIDRIATPPNGLTGSFLSGRWYFQTDGSGDFTVPEPATLAALAGGAVIMRRRRPSPHTR